MTPWQVISSVIGIIVVVAGAYFTTWFFASKASHPAGGQPGRSMRVLDSISLSKDKTVCVLQALGKVYLVAFTGQGATLLDSLAMEDYEQEAQNRRGEEEKAPGRFPPLFTVGGGFAGMGRKAGGKKPPFAEAASEPWRERAPEPERWQGRTAEPGPELWREREAEPEPWREREPELWRTREAEPEPWREREAEPERPSIAQEEDRLDEVYRRIRSRRPRADGETPPPEGGEL